MDLEVDVRRATGVVAGVDRFQGRVPLLVGELDAAQVGLARGAVRGLIRIEAARVAVPDVDGGRVNRGTPLDVDDPDLERERDAGPALGDVLADPVEGDVERALGPLRRQLACPRRGGRSPLVRLLDEARDALPGPAPKDDGGPRRTGDAEGLT